MMQDRYTGILISDFNLSNFSGYLANDESWPKIAPIIAPYGQVAQVLLNIDSEIQNQDLDFSIVWTQPEAVIQSFRRVIDGETQDLDKILAEVDEYVGLLLSLQSRVRFTFIPTWVISHDHNTFAMNRMKNSIGIDNILMRMNLRLSEELEQVPGFYVLNAQNWIGRVGKAAFNPKLWYLSKIPYGNQVFKEAVIAIKSAIRGICGRSRKLLVLDLDDTLWGGIVGEEGWERLQLGGHDPIGEAFVDFQRALKSLAQSGIILGIVSKNDESVALDAIRNHPEMILRLDDFAGWRINWNDKAQNLADLVSGLNLGLDAVVFIDDNPVERARVREMFPEIVVPEWPVDKTLYKANLLSLPFFDAPSLTDEDRQRTRMYIAERDRTSSRARLESVEQWLTSLETNVTCELLNEGNIIRASQLLNKTNQMNLSTRRMSDSEFLEWARKGTRRVWVFRVADKFGDLGIIGIISLEAEGKQGWIVDFVLSCRAMGRKIEEAMLSTAIDCARSLGLQEVFAQYLPTSRNGPCLEFWKRSNFQHEPSTDTFYWNAEIAYPVPNQLQLSTST